MDASLRNWLYLYPSPIIFGTAGATPFSLVKHVDVFVGSVQVNIGAISQCRISRCVLGRQLFPCFCFGGWLL